MALTGRLHARDFYQNLSQSLAKFRKSNNAPLNYTKKILATHLAEACALEPKQYLSLRVDRVAMQDASAQTAVLQFMQSGLPRVKVPATIHCDHLIVARDGAAADLQRAERDNMEVFDFLQSAAQKYGIGFWRPGSGIIHQIVLENYAMPGALMIGTDSHTPNAGGLGAMAIGVGGGDAVDALAGQPWELACPQVVGVHLTGRLSKWTSPKDVILALLGRMGVAGGTGKVMEYFGEGVQSLSCTGMATICNMGAEMGATTSIFPYTTSMAAYLDKTARADVADACNQHTDLLRADEGAAYDDVIHVDLAALEPHINGPFTPDRSFPISKLKDAIKENGYPDALGACLIGSCTNSSYQDIERATHIAKQALSQGLKAKVPFLVTPGSEQIRATIERDGHQRTLQAVGGRVYANACGPCIGQWQREDVKVNTPNSILCSFNRNFAGRNDGNPATHSFLASPEIVTAMAFAGSLSFNPVTDKLPGDVPFQFAPPEGMDLPPAGFERGQDGLLEPPADGTHLRVNIDPQSRRLQELRPFAPWDGRDLVDLPVLVKVAGKCTTDHISPAGPWLAYKGHLENISKCTLIGAKNADTGEINRCRNHFTDKVGAIPDVAADYRARGVGWVVIADTNYGEGSAREHAALQPRFLGCKAIICRSFSRIHETNLKKQGILPLIFAKPELYDDVTGACTVSFRNLHAQLTSHTNTLSMEVRHPSGQIVTVALTHTMNRQQVDWFIAGSALNLLAKQQA